MPLHVHRNFKWLARSFWICVLLVGANAEAISADALRGQVSNPNLVKCYEQQSIDERRGHSWKPILQDPTDWLVPNILGRCYPDAKPGEPKIEDIRKWVEEIFADSKGHPEKGLAGFDRTVEILDEKAAARGKWKVIGRRRATVEDWVAFDLVFRTLVSEASDMRCPRQAVMAEGRAMLNRVDFAKKYADTYDGNGNAYFMHYMEMMVDEKDAGSMRVARPLAQVVKKPYQFNGWNKGIGGNDKTRCPDKAFGWAYENRMWMIAHIAADMVFNEAEFRRQTDNVKARTFTTGEKEGKDFQMKNFAEKFKPVMVDGVPVGNSTLCGEFWRTPLEDNANMALLKKNPNGLDERAGLSGLLEPLPPDVAKAKEEAAKPKPKAKAKPPSAAKPGVNPSKKP